MPSELPQYYFRIRENGAAVFRLETENRQRRIELDEIAVINVKSGNIKPHGSYVLTAADQAAIENWLSERRARLEQREMDDIWRAIDHLNLTAQWAQSKASEAQLAALTDPLLLAMHDLRTVLVRKKSEALLREDGPDATPAR